MKFKFKKSKYKCTIDQELCAVMADVCTAGETFC